MIEYPGNVSERYEYDAYGNCYVLEPNFAPDPDGKSDYQNPYLFTGRRVDILDSGSLKIQYNRNRYYDYYTGRWLTHDPLGITPNPQKPNKFDIPGQYKDGLSLYQYISNNPVISVDAFGTCPLPVGDPRLFRQYFRRYRYTEWRRIFIFGIRSGITRIDLPRRRIGYIDWQYKYSKSIDIAIAAGESVGTLLPKAITVTGWEWPSDKTHVTIRDINQKNYICRIFVKCDTDCCSGDKTWTMDWTPRGPRRLLGRPRLFVYGVMRTIAPPPITGPPSFGVIGPSAPGIGVTCKHFKTWDWWGKKLCTKKDQKRACARKK